MKRNHQPPGAKAGPLLALLLLLLLLLHSAPSARAQYQLSGGAFNDLTPVVPRGLTVQFFNNSSLTPPAVLERRDGPLDFNWPGSPGAGVDADVFSARWEGFIRIRESGDYTFYVSSDDGVRLWIQNLTTPAVDQWVDRAPTENATGVYHLTAGDDVPVKIEFYEAAGGAALRLAWAGPGIQKDSIPASALIPLTGAVDPDGPPVTFPAITGQDQGPNKQSAAATTSASAAVSTSGVLTSRYPSQIYRDGSGQPTGQALLLLQSEGGYNFASGVPRYYMGDVIVPPAVRADGITQAGPTYWRPAPVQPGEVVPHTTGGVETPLPGNTVLTYYYSPHAGRVFATQPGFVTVKWVSRLPEGGRYRFKDETFTVSASSRTPVKRMYWTERGFNAPMVNIPNGRIRSVNAIYNAFFPETVAHEYQQPGVTQEPGQSEEKRTLWLSPNGTEKALRAYNFEGRIFIEYLGAAKGDGVTYEFLGADIVEVAQAAPVKTLAVKLGEQILPEDGDGGLYASPILQAQLGGLFGSTVRPDGRVIYYAERENLNPDNVQFYWLEAGNAAIAAADGPSLDLKWPKYFNNYQQIWPADPADFAQLVVPDSGSTPATGVFFNNGSLPDVVFQDDGSLVEAGLDSATQRLIVNPGGDGQNRSLLKFVSGGQFWYVRLQTQASSHVTAGGRDGTFFDGTATVGSRIDRPSVDYEPGGYVAGGTGYQPGAYVSPYTQGVNGANKGGVIPVNARPGDDVITVWWLRPVVPPNTDFAGFHVASRVGRYTVSYPSNPKKIIMASNEGSGELSSAELTGGLYIQNNPAVPGYNPNEEHAVLIAGRVYALRDDLNVTSGSGYSSEPFTLLSYTSPEDGRPLMSVFKAEREDAAHRFDYPVSAGTILQGPMPLPVLPLALNEAGEPKNVEVTPANIDPSPNADAPVFYGKFTFRDRKGYDWVYRGPHEGAPLKRLEFRFYYAMRDDFYFPGLGTQPAAGTALPYLRPLDAGVPQGNPVSGDALVIKFKPQWPANVPELRVAETLTLPKFGLPAVRGQTSAEVLYQQSVARTGPDTPAVILHDPTRLKATALSDAPGSLSELPPSAATSGSFGKLYFQLLPPHLQNRFYYDPNLGPKGALVLKGEFVNEIAGEDYLHLNALSAADVTALKDIVRAGEEKKTEWDASIDALNSPLETFMENPARRGTYIVDPARTVTIGPRTLAAVGDSDTAVDSYALTASGKGDGFVTLLFSDGEAFTPSGEPVSVKIIKVAPELYTGDLKVLVSANPLDEQVTLRHSGDFAARTEDYEFEWRYAPPQDGVSPATYSYVMSPRFGGGLDNEWTLQRNPSTATGGGNDPITRIVRVTGGDPGEGLDLSGSFRYAFNAGTNGPAGQAGDADFTADDAPGITVRASEEIPGFNNTDLGSSAADDVIEQVFRSIRWSNNNNPDPAQRQVKVDLTGLNPGQRYKLQLLFAENGGVNRRFDVQIDGVLVADDFSTADAQGGGVATVSGSAIVHEFTAGSGTLTIVLDGSDVTPIPGLDQNPILNGVTLEELSLASGFVTLPRGLAIRDNSYNPASALPGVVLQKTAPLDFSAGIPQQIVFSASLPPLDGCVLYVNGTPVLASNAPAGFTNTDSTSGLAGAGLPRQWSLDPGFFTKGLNTIAVALYTTADAGAVSNVDFRLDASTESDRVSAPGSPWLTPSGTLTNVAVVGGNASSPLGSPLLSMSDNYFTMRYRPRAGIGNVAGDEWSRWMPAKLVEGWIKRVLAGINPFNQRVRDLLNNPVNTDVSLLTQAGTRWEGDIALNLANINDYGLIEIYETVLKRGKNMSVDSGYNYGPANDALLLAAGYLNDLYSILGNEAYADAANPTISLDDQNTVTEVNTSRFAFEGQVTSVLEEELALLRGRDDFLNPGVTIAPAYNRLYWNYTRGINSGEALYAVNYNIKEKAGSPTANGNLDAADAQRMFPQGHGDAYGHYLTALKGYYQLLENPNFTWVPRSEAVTVLGQAVQIDYFDERKFARAGANIARSAEQILTLTHRRNYKDDTSAGWSHFRDGSENPRTGTRRRFGLDEWTSRATQGALFNWVVGNAILPDKDNSPGHTGVQIIDRTTVPELREIASAALKFQSTVDNANAGLNPLGLTPDSIAFDISPTALLNGTSHFEQVYERALRAVLNAKGSFDQAARMTRLLRNQENQVDDYSAAIVDQESAFVSRLQDIFGVPYSGDTGPGKTYAQDYKGPDLVNWFIINHPAETASGVSLVDTTETATINVQVPVEVSGFTADHLADVTKTLTARTETRSLTVQPNRFVRFASSYAGFGQRSQTGRLQQALLESWKAQVALLQAGGSADTLVMRFRREAELFTEIVRTHLRTVSRTAEITARVQELEERIVKLDGEALTLHGNGEFAASIGDGVGEIIPENYGVSFSGGAVLKGAARLVGYVTAQGFHLKAIAKEKDSLTLGTKIEPLFTQLEKDLDDLQFSQEARQVLYEFELLFDELTGQNQIVAQLAADYQSSWETVANLLAEGASIMEDREVFRQRAAAIIQGYRTRDLGFRTFRNEALEQYRTLFDLAGRYTYLATKSYDYETGLLGTPEGKSVFAAIVASRSLGDLTGGVPQATTSTLGDGGLAGTMARLQSDWSVAKGRLGINNPDTYGTLFSLRGEAFRILNSPETTRDDTAWQQLLERSTVRNVLSDADVALYCAGIAKQNGTAVPGIIIPFGTTIEQMKNFFGLPLGGGDHDFSSSSFATKIYSAGLCFPGYVGMDPLASGSPYGGLPNANSPLALSATPYVYLIPCGSDTMRAPAFGDTGIIRRWEVKDQALPLPFNLGATQFSSTQFFTAQDTLTEQPWITRKHQAFRAVADASLFYSDSPDEFTCRRLVGRSAWNTKWKIVIPAYTLLADEQEGLNRFAASVKDIQLYFRTYSHSGN